MVQTYREWWMFDIIIRRHYYDGPIAVQRQAIFVSNQYTSFAECLSEYLRFDVATHWPHDDTIEVLFESITYSRNDQCYSTMVQNGILYYNEGNIKVELGVTAEELETCLIDIYI